MANHSGDHGNRSRHVWGARVTVFLIWLLGSLIYSLVQQLRNHVNSNGAEVYADDWIGMWTCVAAMALLFVGSLVVLFTCCSARYVREEEGGVGSTNNDWQCM